MYFGAFLRESRSCREALRDQTLRIYLVIALHSVDRPIPCYVKGVGLHGGGRAPFEDIGAEPSPEQETHEQPRHIDSAQDS